MQQIKIKATDSYITITDELKKADEQLFFFTRDSTF